MENMLAIIFDEESKVYQGWSALRELDKEGTIVVYADQIVQKSPDGTTVVKHADLEFPVFGAGGTAIGAVIGLLGGGPLGMAGGAACGGMAGGLAGSVGDFYRAEVSAEFLDEISAALRPGKFALIADVEEKWVTPTDARMEALGASVIRTAKRSLEAEYRTKELARLRSEIERTEAELAGARADRRAKLQARIDRLRAQLEEQLEQIEQRLEQIKSEAEAKVQAIRAKREKADADALYGPEEERIYRECEQSDERLRALFPAELRNAAAAHGRNRRNSSTTDGQGEGEYRAGEHRGVRENRI